VVLSGSGHISGAIGDLVRRGGFPASLRDDWVGRYTEAGTIEELAPSAFVIESTFEDLDAKRTLFDEIEGIVARFYLERPGAWGIVARC
jgi:3-hydroxyacyl-CoA dehydrogenase